MLFGCGLLALGLLLGGPAVQGQQQPPAPAGKPAAGQPAPLPAFDKNVVAYVNGQPITRQELADELVARKGRLHLQLMINRRIIEQAGAKAGITVTDAEVNAELKKLMDLASCRTAEDYEKAILLPQGTTLLEYREDVIRHGLIVKRLAGLNQEATEDEIKAAFESHYGLKVKCRIIVHYDKKQLCEIHTQINGDKEKFLGFAKVQEDATLAKFGGEVEPVGRGFLDNEVERRAFAMRDGEVSEVFEVDNGKGAPKTYLILLREGTVPPDTKVTLEQKRAELREEVLERKMRAQVPNVFRDLRKNASVRDYLSNKYDVKDVMTELARPEPPPGPRSAQAPGK